MKIRIILSFRFVMVGAVCLVTASTFSQSLFVTAGTYESPLTPIVTQPTGYVYEVAPGGKFSNFAENLGLVRGMAFDNSGNMFLASPEGGLGSILEITPGGVKTTYASGIGTSKFRRSDSGGFGYRFNGFRIQE